MRRRGFSLIELLVVLVILTVLMNLGLAAGRRMREAARSNICKANQRQLGIACMAYDTDHGSLPVGFEGFHPLKLPSSIEMASSPTLDPQGKWWFMFFFTRTEDYWCEPVLTCPSKCIKDLYVGEKNVLCGNYGANRSLFRSYDYTNLYQPFEGAPESLSRLRRPSDTLLLCDSGYTLVSWWQALPTSPGGTPSANCEILMEARSYIPGLSTNLLRTDILAAMQDDALRGRHANKTVNVTFCDGHVANMAAEDLRIDGGEQQYLNKVPLWDP